MKRIGVFLVLYASVSSVFATNLEPPVMLAPAYDQGTTRQPWFRWNTVGTHYYRICIWPTQLIAGYCPNEGSIKAYVPGTDANTQSWSPDSTLPAAWMGERLRVSLMTCHNGLCGDDTTRDFFALSNPTSLTVTVDSDYPYISRFNWGTVRGADSYWVSFCCNASGEPRPFLAPGGMGGRPFQVEEPDSFIGMQDYSTKTVCFASGRPITWTVAACRDGGCGDPSPKHTFCYDFGGTSPPTNAPP